MTEADGGKKDGGAVKPAGPGRNDAGLGSTNDTKATDSGAMVPSSTGDSRAEPAEAAGAGGSVDAADSGSAGMSAMTDAGIVERQPPPAGSPSDPGQPSPDEGEPSSTADR